MAFITNDRFRTTESACLDGRTDALDRFPLGNDGPADRHRSWSTSIRLDPPLLENYLGLLDEADSTLRPKSNLQNA